MRALLGALNHHGVEYLLVGGVAAQGHGATRPTKDLDALVRHQDANLEHLAAALRSLGARLRVEGLSDEDAKELPVQLDGRMLGNAEITTWCTDAGNLDVLTNMPARDGRRLRYEDLTSGGAPFKESTSPSGRRASPTSSRQRNGPTGRKTGKPCPSYADLWPSKHQIAPEDMRADR